MKKAFIILLLIPLVLSSYVPVNAETEKKQTWQDEIIYFLMIDRFNNGDFSNDYDVNPEDPYAYHGGDLNGVTKKLDYIKDLGFTAIWMTPVVDNQEKGYHGYWANDFYKIDEHFGTMEDMKQLVKEAHKRGLKVILDLVVNHVGPESTWLQDETKKDWFHENKGINWGSPESVENGWLMDLPDFNTENPEVEDYLINMAKWWIQETNIDGFRLDTVKHIPKEFWAKFATEVKALKPNFFLLGEVWFEDSKQLAAYEGLGIDSLTNFPFYNGITNTFVKPDLSLRTMYKVWEKNQETFKNPEMLATFIDNHDVARFVRKAKEEGEYPPSRLKLALTYLYATPGIPIVYYGTEIALDGGEDPDNRRLMDFKLDDEFSKYIKKLAEVRKELPSLRYGNFEMLLEEDGLGVFKREYEGKSSIIVINNTSKDQSIHLTTEQLDANKELRGLLEDDIIRSTKDGYDIFITREKANIYSLNEKTGINKGFVGAVIGVYTFFILFLFLLWKRKKRQV